MENNLKNLLRSSGVSLKKAYGQNFLTDVELLDDIVLKAGVKDTDTVLEIGCGAGALTARLARKAKRVVGYEIDTTLKPVLNQTVGDLKNVEIVFKDVMKEKMVDLENSLKGEYIMVANLPYYITTPIVMNFLENAKNIRALVIMVQEEVAFRFAAKPATSDYGAITVAIDLRGKGEVIKKVGREKFTPVPNVDSAVVKIDIEKGKFAGVDLAAVRDTVRAGFLSRRKMLANNLMNYFKLSRAAATEVLAAAKLPLDVRGERLSAEDYVNLTKEITRYAKR